MEKDYKNFIDRMGSFDFDLPIDEEITHYGVKGMKWGVRKSVKNTVNNTVKNLKKLPYDPTDGNPKDNTGKMIKRNVRFRTNHKLKNMSDEELIKQTERLRLENNLKRLTKTINRPDTKSTFQNRDKYSNEELIKITKRLQLEANMKMEISNSRSTAYKMATNTLKNVSTSAATNYLKDGEAYVTVDDLYSGTQKSIKTSFNNETSKTIARTALETNYKKYKNGG